ncbi:MAG: hypothetical protein ACFCUI_03635 [Bernardetiaceae bacterium]
MKEIKSPVRQPSTTWIPNGGRWSRLAITGDDPRIYIYQISGQHPLDIQDFRVISIRPTQRAILDPRGRYYAACDTAQRAIWLHDIETEAVVRVLSSRTLPMRALPTFSTEGALLTSLQRAGRGDILSVWQIRKPD